MPPAHTVSTDSFLESIRNSRLTGEENIRLAIADVPADSVEAVAAVLVEMNILNEWQAKYLLAGHPGLRIGNYILQGRVGQDSLGERFFAVQESLVRIVDLQLLPESLVAEQSGMDRFLESASQLTHLDHHAIVHLYDVADHHGRLFIVSEHCDPMTAIEFRSMPDSGLAHLKAVRDMCEGIRYLHEHDLSHGFLGAENSIRLARPGVIKLDRLAWSVLQRELVSRSLIETFEQRRTADWQQIGIFASRLLESAPVDKALSQPNRDSLVSAFRALASNSEPESRAQLLSAKISDLIARIEKRPAPAANNARLNAKAVSGPEKPKPVPKRTASHSGIRRIASIASLVVLACVVGWFAWGKFGPRSSFERAQRKTWTTSPKGTGIGNNPKSANPESSGVRGNLPTTTLAIDPPLVGDPPVSGVTSGIMAKPETAIVNQPPANLEGGAAHPKTTLSLEPVVIPGTTQASNDTTSTKTGPADGNLPVLPDWPASYALLDGTHHEPQVIGKLPSVPAAGVTVSFEYDPESIGRGKNYFAPEGSGSEWKIAWSKKGVNEEPETVASLRLDNAGQAVFQWNDFMDDKHPANCIVNLAIRINSGGIVNQTWLRETIRFDSPKLDPSSLESSIKLEIPWMPRSDNIAIEFGELLADRGWTAEAMLENETFSNREPARIFFRSLPEERFLWLAFDGRVRGKVELSLNVQTIVGGNLTNLKRQELNGFINAFRANHEALVIRENQAQFAADNAVTGTKTKTKEAASKAKKDTAAGKSQRDLAFEYLGWIEGLIGKPVPVRVMYHVGEQSIELARSNDWEILQLPATETKND